MDHETLKRRFAPRIRHCLGDQRFCRISRNVALISVDTTQRASRPARANASEERRGSLKVPHRPLELGRAVLGNGHADAGRRCDANHALGWPERCTSSSSSRRGGASHRATGAAENTRRAERVGSAYAWRAGTILSRAVVVLCGPVDGIQYPAPEASSRLLGRRAGGLVLRAPGHGLGRVRAGLLPRAPGRRQGPPFQGDLFGPDPGSRDEGRRLGTLQVMDGDTIVLERPLCAGKAVKRGSLIRRAWQAARNLIRSRI